MDPAKLMKLVLKLLKKAKVAIAKGGAFAYIGLAVLLLFLVGWPLWQWRKKKKEQASLTEAGGDTGQPAVVVPTLEPKELLNVHKKFLEALPGPFRRAIADFQPFVVLGPAGAGKTQLINAYTDCERQQKQFLGSQVSDPNLQIYLGSRVMVQELGPNVLNDTSPSARKALTNLWRVSFGNTRPPIVVVPLNLVELGNLTPDLSRNLAEVIRGKINLLSWTLNKPVEVRIALTHVDEVDGFVHLSEFAKRNGIALSVPLEEGSPGFMFEGQLQQGFAGFGRYVSLGLTTLESAEYRAMLRFLQAAPGHLPALARLLESLFAADPLTKPPLIGRAYFTGGEGHDQASNPFFAALEPPTGRRTNPLLWHEVAALLLFAIPVGWFAAGYVNEEKRWDEASTAINGYSASMAPEQEQRARGSIARFLSRKDSEPGKYFPPFFAPGEPVMKRKLSDSIRESRLRPALDEAIKGDWPHLTSLYHLGLLYSAQRSELGAFVRSNVREWSNATGLPEDLIEDYVNATESAYDQPVNLDDLPSRIDLDSQADAQAWNLFLRKLGQAMQRGVFESVDLDEAQADARRLLATVQKKQQLIGRYGEALGILKRLKKSTNFDYSGAYKPLIEQFHPSREYRDALAEQAAFLTMVASEALPMPPERPDTLGRFNAKLRVTMNTAPTPPHNYAFQFLGEDFAIPTGEWDQVILRSALRRHILTFIAQHSKVRGSVFFDPQTQFQPILMNPRNDGTAGFVGKGVLDGRFTARAFEKYVRPSLDDLSQLSKRLEAGSEEAKLLDSFVYSETDRYARAYSSAIIRYYKAFDVQARSASALQVLIRQMLAERSPFSDFLSVITQNTQLRYSGENPYYRPFEESLADFAGWYKLVTIDENGTAPEIDKYTAILQQIDEALTGPVIDALEGAPQPAEEGTEGVTAARLNEVLSPAGRMALAIIKGNPGNHRRQVQDWLDSVRLKGFMRKPFLAPIRELRQIGVRDIEQVISNVWSHRLLVSISDILNRFPFDPTSPVDVTPEMLEAGLHPEKGKFFQYYREYIEPLSATKNGVVRGARNLVVPNELYSTINAASRLSRALWKPDGTPQPYKLKVFPVAFNHSKDIRNVLTLVYLSTGSTSLFNFNQKQFGKALEIDWTRPQVSQIGVQLTNAITSSKTYPNAVVTRDSYWSFLRLLELGSATPPFWSWSFNTGGENGMTTVQFKLAQDPWALFRLRPEREKLPTAVKTASLAQSVPRP